MLKFFNVVRGAEPARCVMHDSKCHTVCIVRMHSYMDGCMYVCIHGWMDGWMDGWWDQVTDVSLGPTGDPGKHANIRPAKGRSMVKHGQLVKKKVSELYFSSCLYFIFNQKQLKYSLWV